MAITIAPVLTGNPDLVTALYKVTMAWDSWQSTSASLPGWHLINGSELGMSGNQLSNGIFTNANAEAIVASATYKGLRTLTIGFRGTNDNEDWRQDFQNINQHYDLFAPPASAVNAAAARGEFDLVLITGHSLGGAMTQMFMANYSGIAPAYAITTGSPGYQQSAAVADSRIINYQVTDDAVVFLGIHRAEVGQALSGLLGSLLSGQIGGLLSQSFGFPASLFTDSVPYLTQNYFSRGTNVVLSVPGHPAAPLSSVTAIATNYNSTAHDFATYQTGINATDLNPFDLGVGSRGTASADSLFGTTGNDSLNGGAGNDTFYLHVNRANAVITVNANGLVSVSSSESGTDTLSNVERLSFADKKLAFDLGANQSAGMTARVIGAALDAPALAAHPDWVTTGLQLFDSGYSLLNVCKLVVNVMGNPTNTNFVTTVYTNVVGSAPSAADLGYFTGLLQGSGGSMTQAEFLQTAALSDFNAINIGLTGLLTTGIEFV